MENKTNFIKKFWNKNDLIIEFVAITVTFCAILIIFIPLFFNIEGDHLSYTGSIVGSGLAMVGIWLTLSYQDKQRKKDLAMQYKPILKFNEAKNEVSMKHQGNILYFSFLCEVENIGRGEALDIEFKHSTDAKEISVIELKTMKDITMCNTFEKILISNEKLECLPTNDKTQLLIQAYTRDTYFNCDCFVLYIDIDFGNAFSKRNNLKHSAKIVIGNNKKMQLDEKKGFSINIGNIYKK